MNSNAPAAQMEPNVTYKPRPGSAGDRAIRTLEAHGKPMSGEALSLAIDLSTNSLQPSIVMALNAGLITKTLIDGFNWYSLPGWAVAHHPEVPAAPAAAADEPAAEREPSGVDIDAAHQQPWRGVISELAKPVAAGMDPSVEAPKWDVLKVFNQDESAEPVSIDAVDTDDFDVGLFSKGMLVLRIGKSIVRLPRKHTETLVKFFDRLAPEVP